MKVDKLEEVLELPEGVQVELKQETVIVKGPKGEVSRIFRDPILKIESDGKQLKIFALNATKTEKKRLFSMKAHLKNMFKGATEGHFYKLKVCSGHFPMNVAFQNNEFIVKNFIGEKIPRKVKIDEDVKLTINGDIIELESVNKEKIGNTASALELLTNRPGFDKRIFQDGIYIIHKDGKDIV